MSVLDDKGPSAGDCQVERGRLATRARRDAAATVVTIAGEIDAANVDAVREYIGAFVVSDGRLLILETTGVEFCGSQGVGMLFEIDEQCRRAGVRWVLVAGAWVSHVLRTADPDHLLPGAASVSEALRSTPRGQARWLDRFLLDY